MRKNSFTRLLWVVSVLCVLLLAVSCGAQETKADLTAEERKLRDKVSAQVEEHWEVVKDPASTAMVEMICGRLAAFTSRDLDYTARILSEESPNAFTIPGGLIYVTTGMLDFVRSDDELAAVIAHELVHADKNHVMKQVARNQKLSVGTLLLTVASGGLGPVAILSNLLQVAVMNEYSRDFEREADYGSIELLYQAGYSPSAAVTILERMQEEEVKRPYVDPGVYRTHPKTQERVNDIISRIREKGWPLERKVPLCLLIPETSCDQNRCALYIDGYEIWAGPPSPVSQQVLERFEEAVREGLQLEIAPYDIHIVEQNGIRKLLIGRKVAALSEGLPEGMAPLDEVREALLEALQRAKRVHPVAEYFR